MEALDHMLTEPLESGAAETNGGIMEECMLGNSRVRLPEDLLEDFLPRFPDDNTAEQERTVSALFNNQNFCLGNPLHLAQKLFRDGYFNPEVVRYRQLCTSRGRREAAVLSSALLPQAPQPDPGSLQEGKESVCVRVFRRRALLNHILVSRKELLELAARGGPELALRRQQLAQAGVW
ncbi:hypothetical protein AALO_G00033560 [Alosa alosa]|uniref:Uncharacterized protein n=1 Tax=Alosa alosa TaxID=278164 RepID=A0AAV6HHV5_9TELE|nr:hypothetical protein AALO_G00033560 [Alosa alosa]